MEILETLIKQKTTLVGIAKDLARLQQVQREAIEAIDKIMFEYARETGEDFDDKTDLME